MYVCVSESVYIFVYMYMHIYILSCCPPLFYFLSHTLTHLRTHTFTHSYTHTHTYAYTHTYKLIPYQSPHAMCGRQPCNICDTATHCNTLQHTATHCNTLQHTATHCNTEQAATPSSHHVTWCNFSKVSSLLNLLCYLTIQLTFEKFHQDFQYPVVCQAHCNTLQQTATHSNTLQHTPTHWVHKFLQ